MQSEIEDVKYDTLNEPIITKKDYFISHFMDSLEKIQELSKEIADESLAPHYLSAILKVAVPVVAGKILGGAIPEINIPNVPGVKVPNLGNTLALAGGILGGWFAYKGITEAQDAKTAAKKITSVFNQLQDIKIFLRTRLYQEFRLSIEMLTTSQTGVGKLIKYFTDCLLESIDSLPTAKIDTLNNEEFIQIFRKTAFDTTNCKIDSCPLDTEKKLDYDLGWQLNELILHSPILLAKIDHRVATTMKSVIFLNSNASKRDHLIRKKKAEGTHKYPVRIVVEKHDLLAVEEFRHDELMLPSANRLAPKALADNRKHSYDNLMVNLYHLLRRRRNKNSDKDIFIKTVNKFIEVADAILSNEIGIDEEPINLLFDIENLRNIYWNELKPYENWSSEVSEELANTIAKLNDFSIISDPEIMVEASKVSMNNHTYEEIENKFEMRTNKYSYRHMMFSLMRDLQKEQALQAQNTTSQLKQN